MSGNLRCERYKKRERTAATCGSHARYYYSRSLMLDAPAHRRVGARPRPRCQSAPKVMDNNHSRSASPRESARPAHRPPSPPSPPSPQSPAGFDNRAFQHDDPNHNDSFASRHAQNGHSKEHNGETKTLEAVNLELINLQPKNGNMKKKDVEVDMNASNPYDEYFVPVNEHRKYMRGEKLYVTADKRGEKGGCRRPLCWTLAGLLAAAVVALAALAAAGVLFTTTPTPVEQYNASISSARALGGIGQGAHDQHHHEHDHTDHSQPHTLGHQPTTLQNEADSIMDLEDTNDPSMYVPRTLEGELKIDNEEFTSALADPDSDEYKSFSESFSSALKQALFNKDIMGSDDNEFFVEVVQLRNGSVIVTYRIHWKPKMNAAESTEVNTASKIQSNLETYLSRSNRMISVHHVAEDKLTMRRVLDICRINKNNCDYGCEFDKKSLEFSCTCPQGQMLDAGNPHTCVTILEPNLMDEMRHKESRVLDLELNTTTEKANAGEHEHNTESQHRSKDKNVFDWKETNHVMPETTTEADTELKFSHIFGHQSNDERTEKPALITENDESKSTFGVTPDMKLEPTSEPEPSSEPEPTSEPEPAAAPEPTSEPEQTLASEPTSEPAPAAEPEPTSEPAPAAEPEPTSEPTPTAEPEPTSKPEPTSASKPISATEPSSKPILEPEPQSETAQGSKLDLSPNLESTTKAETAVESEPTSEPESSSEPEPTSEPEPSKLDAVLELKRALESEPASEPEPTSTPDPASEPTSELQQNSRSEPVTDSMYSQLSKLGDESTDGSKLTVDPISDADAKVTQEVKSEPQSKNEMISGRNLMTESNIKIDPASAVVMMTTDSSSKEAIPEEISQDASSSNKYHPENIDQTHESEVTLMPDLVEFNTNYSQVLKPNSVVDSTSITPTSVSSVEDEIGVPPDNSTNNETVDATTPRMSISQVHIINEPSYEANPEIVSILLENKKPLNYIDKTDSTTDAYYSDGDWLENDKNIKALTDDEYRDKELRHFTKLTDMSDAPVEKHSKSEIDFINMADEEATTPITSLLSKNMQNSTNFNVNHLNDENISVAGLNSSSSMDNLDHHVNKTISTKDYSLHNIFENSFHVNRTPVYDYTTTKKDADNEYTLKKQIDSSEEKHLIKALSSNDTNEITTTTEEHLYNVDITFDSINMLFNRTSKLFNRPNDTDSANAKTENIFYKEPTPTDSDWLSEPVTEINYQEIINRMEKGTTTESSVTKSNDIIKDVTIKDDFEPDYLVNMDSSNNKEQQPEPDVLLYGMVHDYDDEESRVKRVNTESKINTSRVIETEKAKETIETTTTVSEYIYNIAEENHTGISGQSKENSSLFLLDSAEPAPVWEISDSDKRYQVFEQPQIPENNLQYVANTNNHSKSASQNTTPTNFNVTIYEISSNRNHTIPVSKHVNSQSAEYDDHETEMNPFLPEIENNKSLVKKLQEGHDLEPTNLNETQNENNDDHSSTTELQHNEKNFTAIQLPNSSGSDAVPDIFLMNALNSQGISSDDSKGNVNGMFTDSERHKSMNDMKDKKEKEILPISTFLIDTDDLDREHTTEYRPNVVKNNLDHETSRISTEVSEITTMNAQAMIDGSDEYLSVVPIVQDQDKDIPKKHYKSDNILELNDISDSPKKSARRTLDLTK